MRTISIHAPLAGCDIATMTYCHHIDISIHAPLAGCDSSSSTSCNDCTQFQSTHPLRGATICSAQRRDVGSISIHAPLAGCDNSVDVIGRMQIISIHAPLAGCDGEHACLFSGRGNFNPRTPCGVRRKKRRWPSGSLIFQSTHPLRGATVFVRTNLFCAYISIHAPLAGCDTDVFAIAKDFRISIHAPLAGCDA